MFGFIVGMVVGGAVWAFFGERITTWFTDRLGG